MQINKLEFSNWFSYGENNVISFTDNKVTLLSGKNGAGKSSIPSIIEEMLFNKNSRGFRKSDIKNKFSKEYFGTIYFSINNDNYILSKEVKTTAKVTLSKNGKDISGNTATRTYEILQDIIGIDFTSFSKLVYQSMLSSLDFLTLTDAKRKEFLVSLLNLSNYTEIEENLKRDKKDLELELATISGKYSVISSTLASNSTIPQYKTIQTFPKEPEYLDESTLQTELLNLNSRYTELQLNIQAHSSKVEQLEKQMLDAYEQITKHNKLITSTTNKLTVLESENLPKPSTTDLEKLPSVTSECTRLNTLMLEEKNKYNLFRKDAEQTECPVCKSHLNKEDSLQAALLARDNYYDYKAELEKLTEVKEDLQTRNKQLAEYSKWQLNISQLKNSLEELKSDNRITKCKTDIEKIESELAKLSSENVTYLIEARDKCKTDIESIKRIISDYQAKIRQYNSLLQKVTKENAEVESFNKRVDEAKLVYEKARKDSEDILLEKSDVEKAIAEYTVLTKAVKDLINYKIEYSSKQFESLINSYLVKLSAGELALTFKLDNAKLSVTIYNSGTPVEIGTLSTGELLMVKLSTLLAIRKMNPVQINLLFLDEVAAVLTEENRDILINVLLEEPFNTFVVNHSYINPLCASIEVVKDKFSRIICQ